MREKKDKSLGKNGLKSALIKKALGYDTTEIVEEYVSGDEGEIILSKKKVTKKNIPPDITAIKMLIDSELVNVKEMSNAQLEQEKERLLKILSEKEKGEKIERNKQEKGEN